MNNSINSVMDRLKSEYYSITWQFHGGFIDVRLGYSPQVSFYLTNFEYLSYEMIRYTILSGLGIGVVKPDANKPIVIRVQEERQLSSQEQKKNAREEGREKAEIWGPALNPTMTEYQNQRIAMEYAKGSGYSDMDLGSAFVQGWMSFNNDQKKLSQPVIYDNE